MNLYQLQASWDDERARARIAALRAELRPMIRQDCRWLPVLIPLFALVLLGLAVIGG